METARTPKEFNHMHVTFVLQNNGICKTVMDSNHLGQWTPTTETLHVNLKVALSNLRLW